VGGDGGGSFVANVPACAGGEGVEEGGYEEEGELVDVVPAGGGVLEEETVREEGEHDAGEAEGEKEEVGRG